MLRAWRAGAAAAALVSGALSMTPTRTLASGTPMTSQPLRVLAASACIGKQVPDPRPGGPWKVCNCGDDAYYVKEHEKRATLAVADGVGGWGDSADRFSNHLIKNLRAVDEAPDAPSQPLSLLQAAYDQCVRDEVSASTTVCLGVVDLESGKFSVANHGDSGFVVLRGSQAVAASEPMHVRHNTPAQLGCGYAATSLPADSHFYNVQVQAGDFILFFTDGISDTIQMPDLVNSLLVFGLMHTMCATCALAAAPLTHCVRLGPRPSPTPTRTRPVRCSRRTRRAWQYGRARCR